jgi:glutamine amidotransferase
MCRWLAYSGAPVFLDSLILEPENSLVSQSLAAQRSPSPTNGDGFGVGWYGAKSEPGIFRDILPAWNDSNLRNVTAQISSSLFFAHVRASTGTPTARTNCHPFRYRHHLFMHNGQVGGFDQVRRALTVAIDNELFPRVLGNTDSEVLFYLMIGDGLLDEPKAAMARTVKRVEAAMAEAGITEPLRLTAALADGATVHAVRYASDDAAPSLYYGGIPGDANSVLVLSEPLDSAETDWTEVPQGSFLTARDGAVSVQPFAPEAA